MIDLYYWPTPNGWKVSIMLEECELEYRTIPVDIGAGDQFKPEFLRISPNNRMPAIVDNEPLEGGAPLALFESGAILEYLGDKAGRFLPRSGAARYGVLQWVHWQMANLGPMLGNANHFKNYAKKLVDDPEQLAYGTRRFVGEAYTIADIMSWPWASLTARLLDESVWNAFPNLKRWVDDVAARPAVQRGRYLHKEWGERELSEDEQQKRRAILFNQTNESVRAAREAAAKATPATAA
jgi:GST-like protein